MGWEEKYGGIWPAPLRKGETVLSERHLPDLDLVALVVKRADGLLAVSVLQKQNDPQWRLPFWSEVETPAIVETPEDAMRYFQAAIGRNDAVTRL